MDFTARRVWMLSVTAFVLTAAVTAVLLVTVRDQVIEETGASATESALAMWVIVLTVSTVIAAMTTLWAARRAVVRQGGSAGGANHAP